MDKVCILGASSLISKKFISKLNCDYFSIGRNAECDIRIEVNSDNFNDMRDIPTSYNKYLITIGHLMPKKIRQQTRSEILYSISVNLLFVVNVIEHILENNQNARIVVLGSESGKKGSYDTTYFLSKAALRQYVKERNLSFPNQQLVLISPSLIENTNMFYQINDDRVSSNKKENPKNRLLEAEEVAKIIYFLLFEDNGYITNTEIEMNGGKFARCMN